ncbi:MAG: ABC-2 family transporter protein [Actinomycetota bacterium]
MKRGFRRYATYRGATIGGLFTNVIFGFMRSYILLIVLRAAGTIGGYDLKDTLTYVWLTQGLIMTVYMWGWFEIALRIRSGDVITDLYRPLDYQNYWLAEDLGRAAYHAIFRGIPPFLVGAAFFDLRVPEHPATWLAFLLSLLLAVCTSFAIRFLINLAAFWLVDYRGVAVTVGIIWNMLSGFIIPLTLFPGSLRAVANVLPFAMVIQVPIDIFLEKYSGMALVWVLTLQLGWALGLLLVGRALLNVAVKRLVVQGG